VDPRTTLGHMNKCKFLTITGLELRTLCRPVRSLYTDCGYNRLFLRSDILNAEESGPGTYRVNPRAYVIAVKEIQIPLDPSGHWTRFSRLSYSVDVFQ
jgi:hypothetical protein